MCFGYLSSPNSPNPGQTWGDWAVASLLQRTAEPVAAVAEDLERKQPQTQKTRGSKKRMASWRKEPRVGVRTMVRDVTPRTPTCSPREMECRLVGVALGAEPSRERFQKIWIVRAVRLVTFHAAVAGISRYRVVLVNERPLEFRVTADALMFERFFSAHGPLRGMRIMATAADKPSFGNRVMRSTSELRSFCTVA